LFESANCFSENSAVTPPTA